jgi:hypothetical protein
MKKINLLLVIVFLLGISGMAQKNNVLQNGLAPQKSVAVNNAYCKHSQTASSFTNTNYQNPAVNISKGLKSSRGIIKVLILTPDYASTSPLVTGLSAYTDLQITVLDTIYFETLTVADLLPYDVVFAYNDLRWDAAGGDTTVIGNVLADYLDAGGKIVENEFLKSFDAWGMAGDYESGNYSAFGYTTTDTYTATSLGTISDPTHPVLAGVSTLTSTFDDQDPTLATGTTEIADWADGYIAIAVKPNVVSINMLPVDPNNGSPILGFTGDGLILYHNAIVWLAGAPIAHCDVSPVQLTAPLNSDLLTISDSIRVKVVNNDSLPHFDIPISYVIDGGAAYNDTITDTIAGESFVIFTFQQPYDFSTFGHIYDVEIYTSYNCDTVNDNDTLNTTVFNNYDAASVSIDMLPIIGPGTINPLATVENNGSVEITFDIVMNITGGYTSVQAATLAPGVQQQITFDPWNAAVGNYTIEVYTMLSNDMDMTNDTLRQAISVQNLTKAYCYIAYDPVTSIAGPAYTYLQDPSNVVLIADQTSQNFVAAGTWGLGNKWYGAVYGDNTLITLDTVTGARTVIGNIGIGLSGIAFDYTSNTLYGVDWNTTNSNSSLFAINVGNGSATLIGVASTDLLIDLACDTNGTLYATGITNDQLYTIDKSTAVATAVGALGFDAGYAQDMEFDHNNNTCYYTAYNATSGSGEMYVVNTTTGAATLIGAFANGAEITGFAIPFTSNAVITDASVSAITAPSNETSCSLTATETITVTISNTGTVPVSGYDVTYQVNSGTPVTETVAAPLAAFASTTHSFTTTQDLSAFGNYVIKAWTTVTGDINNANDTTSKTVSSADAVITVNIQTDSYGSETTWDLVNNTSSQVVATGGPYAATTYYSIPVCALSTDCYTFTIYDAYGDGICCSYGNGTYEIVWDTTSMGVIPGSFTTSATVANICEPNGINEIENAANLSIYPNPANDVLNISASQNITSIRVTNSFGQLIYNYSVNSNKAVINTTSLSDGVYYLQIETEDGIVTKKFDVVK